MAVRPISANSSAGAPAETAARFICSPLLNAKRTSRSNVKTRALQTHKDAAPDTTKTLVHRHPHIPSLYTPRRLLKIRVLSYQLRGPSVPSIVAVLQATLSPAS